MQPIAAWLVARPERAVFIVIATFLLPKTQLIGSAVLVLLVLSHGLPRGVVVAGLSFLAILVLTLIRRVPASQLIEVAGTIWLPGMVLALMLQRIRSLTLLLQVTVMLAMVVIAGIYIVLGDPAAHWREVLQQVATMLRDSGMQKEADIFVQLQPFAPLLTGIFVSVAWLLYVAAFLAGYAAYISLPGHSDSFGRISDLNFGRVLALLLALTSFVAMFSSAVWLQNVAFVLFAVFWLQGLALLHWLRSRGRLPGVALAAVYVLTIVLGPVLVPAVGVLGYTDAWFDFRPRIAKI